MTHDRIEGLLAIGDEVVARARAAGADVAEAAIREGSHLSVKVRLQKPELVEEAGSRSLGLRVLLGQRVAVTYTSDLSARGVTRLVEDAIELAGLAQPDSFAGPPEASLLSKSSDHRDLDLFDASMSGLDAGQALERAMVAEKAALDMDARIDNSDGGSVARVAGASGLVTSGGFRAAYEGTYSSIAVRPVVSEGDGKKRSGSYWSARRHLADIEEPRAVGEEAARRTLRKLGARKVPTQEAMVVFDRDVAAAMLDLLAGCVNGSAIWRRSSYLMDREGTEVASPLVTVIDDPLIPKAPGSRPYDGEGLLSRRNVIVDKGVLKTYLMDTYAARKLGKESTASASRSSSGGVGPSTSNFILQPGDVSHDELVGATKQGLYVTDMMGFGFNGVTGDFSRGAAGFWIENGELTHPVAEVTISLNLDTLLKRIDLVADDLDMRTATSAPTFRVSAMTIAGGSAATDGP